MLHFKFLITLIITATSLVLMGQNNIYEFKVKALEGGEIDFSQYKGKKILIVNTASECGFTGQYKQLQELWELKKESLIIIGFPANNFGKQEPGSDAEIKTFCTKNYGVSFPMASKVSVKGDDQHALFTWLCSQENQDFTGQIRWNFEKFLLDENGKLIRRYRSKADPAGSEILDAL
ncbi:MAG: glutathione peroxidase [Crocinitomicaceae bacterium]|nr:glutathione peroxidase [Crocinitomicaceae bacterium]|tara:strand:- start:2990 stop:3520 length:531 start_codon:yes stop_codon:yes gene_type:complete